LLNYVKGNGFNRHYWARFEDFSRQLLKDWKDVFICTGGLYIPKEVTMNDNTKKYVVEYEVIGNPPTVAVPTHFYKVVFLYSIK
jgi:endonuclease G